MPRGGPDKYTDRDTCVIKKESWPKASFKKDKKSIGSPEKHKVAKQARDAKRRPRQVHRQRHVCYKKASWSKASFKKNKTSIRWQEKHEVVRQAGDTNRRPRQVHRQRHVCD